MSDNRLGCEQDPEQFEADGGWNFLDMEGDSGEEEEESEEGDPEFQGESDEEGASSEDYRSAPTCVRQGMLVVTEEVSLVGPKDSWRPLLFHPTD